MYGYNRLRPSTYEVSLTVGSMVVGAHQRLTDNIAFLHRIFIHTIPCVRRQHTYIYCVSQNLSFWYIFIDRQSNWWREHLCASLRPKCGVTILEWGEAHSPSVRDSQVRTQHWADNKEGTIITQWQQSDGCSDGEWILLCLYLSVFEGIRKAIIFSIKIKSDFILFSFLYFIWLLRC